MIHCCFSDCPIAFSAIQKPLIPYLIHRIAQKNATIVLDETRPQNPGAPNEDFVICHALNPTVNVDARAIIPVLHLWNERVEINVLGETSQVSFSSISRAEAPAPHIQKQLTAASIRTAARTLHLPDRSTASRPRHTSAVLAGLRPCRRRSRKL